MAHPDSQSSFSSYESSMTDLDRSEARRRVVSRLTIRVVEARIFFGVSARAKSSDRRMGFELRRLPDAFLPDVLQLLIHRLQVKRGGIECAADPLQMVVCSM